jgi:hypothetical protein
MEAGAVRREEEKRKDEAGSVKRENKQERRLWRCTTAKDNEQNKRWNVGFHDG